MRRITLTGGPRDGKTYDVPDNADTIPARGGNYRLTPKTGKWEPTKPAQARAARPRASKPKRARGSKETVEIVDETKNTKATYAHATPTVADGTRVETGDQIGTINQDENSSPDVEASNQ